VTASVTRSLIKVDLTTKLVDLLLCVPHLTWSEDGVRLPLTRFLKTPVDDAVPSYAEHGLLLQPFVE
jgi:hypothetical protein